MLKRQGLQGSRAYVSLGVQVHGVGVPRKKLSLHEG